MTSRPAKRVELAPVITVVTSYFHYAQRAHERDSIAQCGLRRCPGTRAGGQVRELNTSRLGYQDGLHDTSQPQPIPVLRRQRVGRPRDVNKSRLPNTVPLVDHYYDILLLLLLYKTIYIGS